MAAGAIGGRRTLRLPEATLEDLARIREFITDVSTSLGAAPEAVPDVVIAVNEAVANVLRHGYRGSGPIDLEVDQDRATGSIVVRLRDTAPAFDPTGHPAPDLTAALEVRRPGGFGIDLARKCVDQLAYRRHGASNELTFVKELPKRDERTAT
jgi:phosphoserine phosphatase RsbU/P